MRTSQQKALRRKFALARRVLAVAAQMCEDRGELGIVFHDVYVYSVLTHAARRFNCHYMSPHYLAEAQVRAHNVPTIIRWDEAATLLLLVREALELPY